jgi:predicted PurR-regulated permease PerM
MTTPRRIVRRSRLERRVTVALKVLALIVLAAVVVGALLAFVARVRSFAVIAVGALFFTYAVHPAVRRLAARVPLVWAIVIVYAIIAVVAGFGLAVVLPALAADAQSLARSMPAIVHNAQRFLGDPENPVLARLPQSARTYLSALPEEAGRFAQAYAARAATGAVGFVLSAVALLATVVVIPVLSVYLMIEAPALIEGFVNAMPPRARPKTRAVMRDVDKVLGGFIRGQLTVGATIGTAITLVLLVMHIKYALLIGVFAGLFDVIPYVGAIVAFVPSVLLAFFNDGPQHAAIIAVAFLAIFQLEGHVIAPRIVSDSVGLSPLMVIVAILIGADLGGIGGMFVSVPIAALARVVFLHSLPRYGNAAASAAPEKPPKAAPA